MRGKGERQVLSEMGRQLAGTVHSSRTIAGVRGKSKVQVPYLTKAGQCDWLLMRQANATLARLMSEKRARQSEVLSIEREFEVLIT